MTRIQAQTDLSLVPGQPAILGPEITPLLPGQLILTGPVPPLLAGTFLGAGPGKPWLKITGSLWLPGPVHAFQGFQVQAISECTFSRQPISIEIWREQFSLAWITLSDKGAQGLRIDESGPLIPDLVKSALSINDVQGFLIPDSKCELQRLLTYLALDLKFDLIISSGGTGVTSSDISPEVTAGLVQRRLPGFEQAMMHSSLAKTPYAMISRAAVGILEKSLIINLPGSPKGLRENLTSILPALKHTLDKIHDDPRDCGETVAH